jgi:hypothetical protein
LKVRKSLKNPKVEKNAQAKWDDAEWQSDSGCKTHFLPAKTPNNPSSITEKLHPSCKLFRIKQPQVCEARMNFVVQGLSLFQRKRGYLKVSFSTPIDRQKSSPLTSPIK